MRKTALAGTALIGLAVFLTACGTAEEPGGEMMDDQPSSESMDEGMEDESMGEARSGALEGDPMVSGAVTVADGSVELTDFAADGSGLHLYLAEGDDAMAVEGGLDLGELSGDAEQSFDAMGDVASYTHVVVYEPMEGEVYAAAELM